MTGYGQARQHDATDAIDVEVRSVNHRYLKVHSHLPEFFASREGEVEEAVRGKVKRGTIDVEVRALSRAAAAGDPIDLRLMKEYHGILNGARKKLGIGGEVTLDALLSLPGVVREQEAERAGADRLWPKVAKTLSSALDDLDASRKREGGRLGKALDRTLREIAKILKEVEKLAPTVTEHYRDRLTERVGRLMGASEPPVAPSDLAREIAIFADRCDISEEIARQDSHIVEFAKAIASDGDVGRRLDFIAQEMLREANTMGSKANDIRLSQRIIGMKAEIEKLKEQIQNIE